MRLIDIAGGPYRVISMDEGIGTPYPFVWSKDGKMIWAVQMIPDENTEGGLTDRSKSDYNLVTISVADGTIKKVLSKPKGVKSSLIADVSADGKYYIYDGSQDSDRFIFDIHLVTADGKKDVLIAPHSAHDWAPQWSKDGKQILFLSNRTGSNALWSVKVENGIQVGEPVLLKESLPNQLQVLGITDAGGYYFGTSNLLSDLYIVDMNLETGKLITQPEKLKVELEAFNFKPLWLPDGKSLVYMSQRKDLSPPWFQEAKIVTHNIETGRIHSIVGEGFSLNPNVQWSYHTITKNGKSLVGLRSLANEINSFIKIDLVNGESEVLKKKTPDNVK